MGIHSSKPRRDKEVGTEYDPMVLAMLENVQKQVSDIHEIVSCPVKQSVESLVPTKVGEAEVLFLIAQIDDKITSKSAEVCSSLSAQLDSIEAILLDWRVKFATREASAKKYEASQEEVEWVKLSSRFYLAYVRYYLLNFEKSEYAKSSYTKTFLSHPGNIRRSYAGPLKDYLEKHEVGEVFMASDSLRYCDGPFREMLNALMQCNLLWCVFTEDCVARPWMVREYLVGVARYILEGTGTRDGTLGREGGFRLLIDCLEVENREHGGTWMDKLFLMKSLEFYENDNVVCRLPSMVKDDQSLIWSKRYEMIASKILIPDRCIRRLPSVRESDCEGYCCDKFPETEWEALVAKPGVQTVRILNTWVPNLPNLIDSLQKALERGVKLQILLLDPESNLTQARDLALKRSLDQPNGVLKEDVARGIHDNLKRLDNLGTIVPNGTLEVRLFNSLPSFSVFQVDMDVIVGFYFHGCIAISMTQLFLGKSSKLGENVRQEFDILWKHSKVKLQTPGTGAYGRDAVSIDSEKQVD